ncbi:phage holin family protein [Arthrobacter halodurans]|uniref:Phage holin family protein n=1 Tax=Arthrobacter halodurans TaxID=516699 RepID=A0ABV4UNG6_9MICC
MAGSAPERRRTSLAGLVRLGARLVPKQLNDELQLAIAQMKAKGIQVGVAAAIVVVALVFAAAMAVSLLVAAIMGLAEVMEPWLAALLVAAVFLVLAGIFALVGVSKVKKALPLVPEDALRGIRYDLGILKEGSSFDPATLDKKPEEPEAPPKDERPAEKAPEVPYDELLRRSRLRRDHLAEIRDDLGPKLDVKTRASEAAHRAGAYVEERVSDVPTDDAARLLREKWQPLAVMTASLVALAAFVRQLAKR